MIPQQVRTEKERIEKLIRETEEAYEPDDPVSTHLAKYICVLCSGFMENAVYQLYKQFAERQGTDRKVQSYVESQLIRIHNPNAKRLYSIAKQFSPRWENELKVYMGENGRAEALGTIMKQRHKIAHGEDSDITLYRVKEYLEKLIEIVTFIASQCQQED